MKLGVVTFKTEVPEKSCNRRPPVLTQRVRFRELYHNHLVSSFCGLIFAVQLVMIKLSWKSIKHFYTCFVYSFYDDSALKQ